MPTKKEKRNMGAEKPTPSPVAATIILCESSVSLFADYSGVTNETAKKKMDKAPPLSGAMKVSTQEPTHSGLGVNSL